MFWREIDKKERIFLSRRIDDIEILRGFAVLFVVAHHAMDNLFTWKTPRLELFSAYFSGGFGVDLFFAISGFVIARDLVPRLTSSPTVASSFRITVSFWIRRAWRLLPSAWFWLAVTLIMVVIFNQSGAFGGFRSNLAATVAGVLQVANIRFAETFGQSEYGVSFVYWSLSLEEQFYFLLPLLVIVGRRFLPYLLLALVLFQLFSTRTLLGIVFRSDALALGVLLALWYRQETYIMVRPAFLKGWGTLLLLGILASMAFVGALKVVAPVFSLFALLSILLVWAASYDMDVFLPHGRLRKLLLWVGARSYAIYLIHVPVFYMTREIWFRLSPDTVPDNRLFLPYLFTAGLLLTVLSELNFRLIEVPFRRRGAEISQRFLTGESGRPHEEGDGMQRSKG
ncbi:acyltransferase family protein [Pseudomonas indica]|nr:acyltransferase [Pseudomonas indica]